MKINFLWGKSNVVSMYSWKHPELAIYDPNREEEEHWVAWKMHQVLSDNNNETYKPLIKQRQKPKGPFIPRII
tara:strand:- start:21 stop:239 length:219 start_codon:yes stop_codon:yes gene_type:complete